MLPETYIYWLVNLYTHLLTAEPVYTDLQDSLQAASISALVHGVMSFVSTCGTGSMGDPIGYNIKGRRELQM